ncbi:coiled-coil domain-containing protein 77 isoform X1 [Hydra vulgaris]|uniref:coiled-coil domain-containing protein 77 isoform X1 n=1 Tax=Hydra vulgaris TaxID=6087 RepID=UPI001F5F5274|nr:coiled-coil domain-containing protein 77 [Hydra vulgaris]
MDCSDISSESPIPSVSERLSKLNPSKELLEYYRKKIIDYDNEHDEFLDKLEKYKSSYEEQHKLECELRQRDDEIKELQKALSDMQIFLFQEREHVLHLYAENDCLKIQELNDRKKIQHLLSLTQLTDNEITYFLKDQPLNIIPRRCDVRSPNLEKPKNIRFTDRGPGGHHKAMSSSNKQTSKSPSVNITNNERQNYQLQIESLQAQLEEQTKLSREQINSLLEDRKVQNDEQKAQQVQDAEKILRLTDNLQKTQTLLYESTKDYLEVKYEIRLKERKWVDERDKILQEMNSLREKLCGKKKCNKVSNSENADTQNRSSGGSNIRLTNLMVINQLRNSLEQTQNMAEMYREQVIGLEDELARIKEENDNGKDSFKIKVEKLTQRLQLMNQRYEALEKRRELEVEGFKNDIKIMRQRLKDVEKQLFKVTVNIGDQFDFEILKNVHSTAHRAKKIAGELHNLKSHVYGLERELKNL